MAQCGSRTSGEGRDRGRACGIVSYAVCVREVCVRGSVEFVVVEDAMRCDMMSDGMCGCCWVVVGGLVKLAAAANDGRGG